MLELWNALAVIFAVKQQAALASFFGSIVSIRFVPAGRWHSRVFLVLGGFCAGAFGSVPIARALAWPEASDSAVAFLVGMFAMHICDAVARAIISADLWALVRAYVDRKKG